MVGCFPDRPHIPRAENYDYKYLDLNLAVKLQWMVWRTEAFSCL